MSGAQIYDEDGRCVEEDLVKSFFPSLFDSDSDTEDVYRLRPSLSEDVDTPFSATEQPSPQSSNVSTKLTSFLGSPISKANSTSLLHLSRCHEALPDSGSPLSQENSCRTAFQTGPLEHSNSIGDQSAFHSVLSVQSSGSLIESDSRDGSPAKKRKVELPSKQCEAGKVEALGQAAPSEAQTRLRSAVTAPPAMFQHQAGSSTGHMHGDPISKPVCLAGSITTGVPVDSCRAPDSAVPKGMTLGRSQSSHMATPYSSWPMHSQALPSAHSASQGQLMGNWRSPQAMIPTAAVPPPTVQPLAAQRLPASAPERAERIMAALAEVSKAPVAQGPLGLKLDKLSVMHQLAAMGVRYLGA